MRDLVPAPDHLLDDRGEPREGAYAGAIPDASSRPLARVVARGLGPLAAPAGRLARLRALRLKNWRFFGAFDGDRVVAAAIADVGYLGVVFAYAASGERIVERHWTVPGGLGLRVGDAFGASSAWAPGRSVSIVSTRDGGHALGLELPGLRGQVEVTASAEPITIVSDVGRGRGLPGVTVKWAGARARGNVEVEGRTLDLANAHACVDWTAAYFPRRTEWWWAAAAGVAASGEPVGLNLARGVHDDARGRFDENVLWVGGRPAACAPVSFGVGSGSSPWTVRSEDRSVDLVFEPRGERGEDVGLVLIQSRYRQPYGTFSGKIRDARGREVELRGVPGVTEHHLAVW